VRSEAHQEMGGAVKRGPHPTNCFVDKITYLPNLTKSCGATLWTLLLFMIKTMYGLILRRERKYRH